VAIRAGRSSSAVLTLDLGRVTVRASSNSARLALKQEVDPEDIPIHPEDHPLRLGRSSKGILCDYLQALPALAQPQEQRTSRCHKQLRPHLRSSLCQARSAHLRPVLPHEPRPRRHLGQSRHPALPQRSPGFLVSPCTRNNLRSRRSNLEQLNRCPHRRDARQFFVPRVWHLHRQRSHRLNADQSRRQR
jgi:hypothetical protein